MMLVYVKLQLSPLKCLPKNGGEEKKNIKFQQEYINNLDYQTESVKILEVKSSFFFPPHNLEHKYEQLILIL